MIHDNIKEEDGDDEKKDDVGTYEDAGAGAEEVNGENVNRDELRRRKHQLYDFWGFYVGLQDKFENISGKK